MSAGMFSLRVGPEGIKVGKAWEATALAFPKQTDVAMRKLAETTALVAKRVVETQAFKRVPLKPRYAARKERAGLDPRILIATKDYINGFRTQSLGPAHWAVLCDLKKMKLLENGTRTMQARPHWGPVIAALQVVAPAMFAKEVLRALLGG